MTTQAVIVYTNPVTAAFWESGVIVPFMVFILTFLVILGIGMQILGSIKMNYFLKEKLTYTVLAAALVAAFTAIWYYPQVI